MADMSRDDFLAFMISELSAMKSSESGLEEAPQPCSTEEVLQKFSFDFPLLEESQVEQLTAYLLSLKHNAPFELPKKQFLNAKFMENVTYMTSAQSYATYRSLSSMFGACYVSLPLSCLHMSAKALNKIFPSPRVDRHRAPSSGSESVPSPSPSVVQTVYAHALQQVFTLIRSTTPSLLLRRETLSLSPQQQQKQMQQQHLSATTAEDLAALVCMLVDVVTSPETFSESAATTNPGQKKECGSLLGFLSQCIAEECHATCYEGVEEETQDKESGSVISEVMDLLSHLMYLVRDIVVISSTLFDRLIQKIMNKVLSSIPPQCLEQKLSHKKKKKLATAPSAGGGDGKGTGVPDGVNMQKVLLQQIHMLLFHVIAQVTLSFHAKFSVSPKRDIYAQATANYEESISSPYGALIASLRETISSIIIIVENIKISLQINTSQSQNYFVAIEKLFDSLTAIGVVLVESSFSASPARAVHESTPCTHEEVFLTSQLLPFLVRTAFTPAPSHKEDEDEDEERGKKEKEKDGSLLYTALSVTTRKKFLALLMGLSLLPPTPTRMGGDGDGAARPFAAYIFRSSAVFSEVLRAESTAFALPDTQDVAGSAVASSSSVLFPSLLGCTYAAMRSGVCSVVSLTRKQDGRSTDTCDPAHDAAYSALFSQMTQNICTQIIRLNRHCCNQPRHKDGKEDVSPSGVKLGDVTSICQCSKEFLYSQKELNHFLYEVNYTLWTIQATHCSATLLNASAREGLRSCVTSLNQALSALTTSSAACPSSSEEASASAAGNKQLDGEQEQEGEGEGIGQFNDMFVNGDIQQSESGGEDEEKIKNEVISPAAWRSVYGERRKHTYNLLKVLKMLSAALVGAVDSKTD